MPESSQNNYLLGFGFLRRSTFCIHAVVDAGIHQHDDKDI